MSVSLVTLDQAKARARVIANDDDDDILTMIQQASQAVIDRVDDTDVTDAWGEEDEDTIPDWARAATLEMLVFLYERDQSANERPDLHGRLPYRAELHVIRHVRPALA